MLLMIPFQYTTRVHRTIREVLSEFRSVSVPREHIFEVFELFPPLRAHLWCIRMRYTYASRSLTIRRKSRLAGEACALPCITPNWHVTFTLPL